MTPGVICLTDHEVAVTRRCLETSAKVAAGDFGITDRRVRQIVEAVERKTGLSRASLTVLLLTPKRPRKASETEYRQLAMSL